MHAALPRLAGFEGQLQRLARVGHLRDLPNHGLFLAGVARLVEEPAETYSVEAALTAVRNGLSKVLGRLTRRGAFDGCLTRYVDGITDSNYFVDKVRIKT